MAIYHKAIRKMISPGSNDPRIHAVGIIYHVAVSRSDSLYDYFAHRSNGIESHFYIRFDGTIEQYRDTGYEADANYHGNSWVKNGKRYGFLSVETEGMGEGLWTDAQVESLKALTLWAAAEHGFPLRKAPGPYSPGVGYHRMFAAWNPNAHSCPGPDRVKQFNRVFVPWFGVAANFTLADKMNPAAYFIGAHGPHVTWLGERLVAHGFGGFYKSGPGPTFTDTDRACVRAFQKAQGWTGRDADGFPGHETLKRLAADEPKHKGEPAPEPVPAPVEVPTRLENFWTRFTEENVIDLNILDRAVKGGRKGTVKTILIGLRALVMRLPRK